MIRKVFNICTIIIFTFFFVFNLYAKTVPVFCKEKSSDFVIVIDPGHGGFDLGASVGNVHEKNIVLEVGLKLGELIQKNFPDIKILFTRDSDVFIPVYERAKIANHNNANLFISIHVNAVEQTFVKGTETYVLGQHQTQENLEVAKKENSVILLEDNYNTTYEGFDPESPESYIMFELIQNEYIEQSVLFASEIQKQFEIFANRENRSVKQSGFIVLRQIAMPGVLIEAGFLSNREEREYMCSNEGQTEIAMSVFSAFKEYKKQIEEKSSFLVLSENNKVQNERDSISQSNNQETAGNAKETDKFYSVQILASKKKMKPRPSRFKGEKQVFRIDFKTLSYYFSGRFNSIEEAVNEQERVKKKYRQAFVVAFENGKLISVKKAVNTKN